MQSTSLFVPMIAGGVAGTITDITLFPLDTIKTRLQQASPCVAAPSVRSLYQGIGPAALASAPAASIFFVTYDFAKTVFPHTPLGHGLAAACGEVTSALFKVPFEVVKQRLQATTPTSTSLSSIQTARSIYTTSGVRGCYAGLSATLAREIPFGFIQMPVYEWLKSHVVSRKTVNNHPEPHVLSAVEACACGAVAGGIAAAATCPIDVWKTRLMLGDPTATIPSIVRAEGLRALFAGVAPRVVWISLGGCLFFGAYEKVRFCLIQQG